MRYFFATLILLAWNVLATSTPNLVTELELQDGKFAKLYWEVEYEGYNTLIKMEFKDSVIDLKKLDAIGQPVFSPKNRFIALPYCAHDGCLNRVNIFDSKNEILLAPIHLETEGQMYLKCVWNGNILSVIVEDYIHSRNEKKSFERKFMVTDSGARKI